MKVAATPDNESLLWERPLAATRNLGASIGFVAAGRRSHGTCCYFHGDVYERHAPEKNIDSISVYNDHKQ